MGLEPDSLCSSPRFLPLSSCVSLGKLHELSGSYFPHVYKADDEGCWEASVL